MNNVTPTNINHQQLVIANIHIKQDADGRYCLNDFHKAAGSEARHKPSNFLRIEQTKELIEEIEQGSDMRLAVVHTIHGGNGRGTYVLKELVYSYAMWISAKFHLHVIRAYDSLVNFRPPLAPVTNLDILAGDTTNKVHDYIHALHREIDRLNGNTPQYPHFDKETIVRAVVTRMVDMSRMLLTISPMTGKPNIQFVPNDSWILNSDNIASVVGDPCGVPKKVLPDIIKAAANRLG